MSEYLNKDVLIPHYEYIMHASNVRHILGALKLRGPLIKVGQKPKTIKKCQPHSERMHKIVGQNKNPFILLAKTVIFHFHLYFNSYVVIHDFSFHKKWTHSFIYLSAGRSDVSAFKIYLKMAILRVLTVTKMFKIGVVNLPGPHNSKEDVGSVPKLLHDNNWMIYISTFRLETPQNCN